MQQLIGWSILLLGFIGLAVPVVATIKLSGWQKEVTATLIILALSVMLSWVSWLAFKTDFMVIFTRALLFEGLPYGFALRYITLQPLKTTKEGASHARI